ncbi:PIN domain-containing protein [Kocuria sp. KD4]|uniref:PIN domain-containing protein n=1 Tax=Kocuria sp. KD4 TaxID=2719588 RepID=UPI00197D93F9|nr:PIN domain-containing protein [Kocuria sp. KD4]
MRIDSHAYRRSTTASGHGQAIQAALVENYESLVPAMTNDPKDRHVLAAAVRSRAELIVTSNQKDFPTTALKLGRPLHSVRSLCESSVSD